MLGCRWWRCVVGKCRESVGLERKCRLDVCGGHEAVLGRARGGLGSCLRGVVVALIGFVAIFMSPLSPVEGVGL